MSGSLNSRRPVFVAWVNHHGRTVEIADALGMDLWMMKGTETNTLRRYCNLWRKMRSELTGTNPPYIIVQQPPIFALLATYGIFKNKARIVGDLHTGTFDDPKWRWALPIVRYILKKRNNFALVTNTHLAKELSKKGVSNFILHDIIRKKHQDLDSKLQDKNLEHLFLKCYVLVPLAYAYDEPLAEIISATHLDSEIFWVFTGNAPKTFKDKVSQINTFCTGFVSENDYAILLAKASAVLALTTQENTMQRVGYEALSSQKALVISDKKVLRNFFESSALYTTNESGNLVSLTRDVLRDKELYEMKVSKLLTKKIQEQKIAIDNLFKKLHDEN